MFGTLDAASVIGLLCGLGVATTFGLIAFALADGPGARRYKRRLVTVNRRARGVVEATPTSTTRSLSRRESATPTMDRIVRAWLPRRDVLVARLARTGREITIGQYAMVTVGLSAAATIIITCAGLRLIHALPLGIVIGLALPHMVIGYMGRKRVNAFVAVFPDAIDLMVRALRSGLPISEAVVTVGHEIADPIGSEFSNIEAGMRLGRELESLLWEATKRIDAPEFRFFIIALSVQRETGGNLAETLNNLSDVLRRRRAMRAKARAMSSEARASTMILGSLPLIVTVVLMLTSPSYISMLFTDVRGLVLIGIAVGMLLTGIGIMVRMAKFDV
jgi:tight adherence protein B